jgi:predicted O-methyltransferase YrrM
MNVLSQPADLAVSTALAGSPATSEVPFVIAQLRRELYGAQSPFDGANPDFVDDGYTHTHIGGEFIESVLKSTQPRFWLEIGTMLGGSAIKTADTIKRLGLPTGIVCIDPFCGSAAMWAREQMLAKEGKWLPLQFVNGRPSIYDRFLANIISSKHNDIILPVMTTSIVGLKLLLRLHAEKRIPQLPDVIYLDSAHLAGETMLELRLCWSVLGPGGVLVGDDWGVRGVRNDLLRFAPRIQVNQQRMSAFAAALKGATVEGNILLYRGQWLLAK